MNDDEQQALVAWATKLEAELGLSELNPDIDQILGLAGVAAHAIVRPAAPVTTFLVGYAAGYAAHAGTDPAEAIRSAVELAENSAKSQ